MSIIPSLSHILNNFKLLCFVNLTILYYILLSCTVSLYYNNNNLTCRNQWNLLIVLFVIIYLIEIFIFSLVEEPSLWIGSDRDYTYDELLIRVFNIMREKNPDMVAGKKQKFNFPIVYIITRITVLLIAYEETICNLKIKR